MFNHARRFVCFAFLLCASLLFASPKADLPRVVTHDNLQSAGEMVDGVLTIHLVIQEAAWTPDADDAPTLPILAFGEEGKAPSIPGPMLRIPQGTRIHAIVRNTLLFPAFVHGLHERPGKSENTLNVPPLGSAEVTFTAGEPGSYYYWATTGFDVPVDSRQGWDTQLDGALIVDAPGERINDRVMVIGYWYQWLAPLDFDRGFHQVLVVNGKQWPHTTRLSYAMGDTIHWRVLNPSVGIHPMHLHGAYFRVDSEGDAEKDVHFPDEQRRSVVTELMPEGSTMAITWTPPHPGNWLFHCHLEGHFDGKMATAVSEVMGVPVKPEVHEHGGAGMAGLVVGVSVRPLEKGVIVAKDDAPRRHLKFIISEHNPGAADDPIEVGVQDGDVVRRSADGARSGPPLVLHRGEPTEITVINQLKSPTAIHWHGMEIESYYDGVVGFGGSPTQSTPSIAPGESFTVRVTPAHAGTFIYHTHWHDPDQLTKGLYGPLIVLEPGERYDSDHDRTFVIGRESSEFEGPPLLVNGSTALKVDPLRAGEHYRLRFIDMSPNDDGDVVQLVRGDKPVQWTALAKDGATLPAFFHKAGDAKLRFGAGETYDFEFTPDQPGKLSLETSYVTLTNTVPIEVVPKR